jgi:hypothetical protein
MSNESFNFNQNRIDSHENEMNRLDKIRKLEEMREIWANASTIKKKYNELYAENLTNTNPPKEKLESLHREWEDEVAKLHTLIDALKLDTAGIDTIEGIDNAITQLLQGKNL